MDLTDAQWAVLQPFLHPKPVRKRGRPWQDARAVFNGILWVLRTGAPWHDLPDRYPNFRSLKNKHLCFQWGHGRVFTTLGPFPGSWGGADSGVAAGWPDVRWGD